MSHEKSKGITAILSLIIPGSGHMYQEQIGKGFMWLIFVVMGYAFWIIPGLVLHVFCIISSLSQSGGEATSTNHSSDLKPLYPDDVHPDMKEKLVRDQRINGKKFIEELQVLNNLKSKNLIEELDLDIEKEKLIQNLFLEQEKSHKNVFLNSIIEFIDSGLLNPGEVEAIKSKLKND